MEESNRVKNWLAYALSLLKSRLRDFIGLAQCHSRKSTNGPRFVSHIPSRSIQIIYSIIIFLIIFLIMTALAQKCAMDHQNSHCTAKYIFSYTYFTISCNFLSLPFRFTSVPNCRNVYSEASSMVRFWLLTPRQSLVGSSSTSLYFHLNDPLFNLNCIF